MIGSYDQSKDPPKPAPAGFLMLNIIFIIEHNLY